MKNLIEHILNQGINWTLIWHDGGFLVLFALVIIALYLFTGNVKSGEMSAKNRYSQTEKLETKVRQEKEIDNLCVKAVSLETSNKLYAIEVAELKKIREDAVSELTALRAENTALRAENTALRAELSTRFPARKRNSKGQFIAILLIMCLSFASCATKYPVRSKGFVKSKIEFMKRNAECRAEQSRIQSR